MERKPPVVEFVFRLMYLVFLLYAAIVIGAGVSSAVSMLGLLFSGDTNAEAWLSGVCCVGLLWMLTHVRDFWARHFDFYRMDDNFSGVSYLDSHLDHPEWPRVLGLIKQLNVTDDDAVSRDAMRRQICSSTNLHPALYEAVYELADDRLRWTLENCRR